MKTEKQIKERIKILTELLENEAYKDEIIMGGRQRSMIKAKVNLLKWVLEAENDKNNQGNTK